MHWYGFFSCTNPGTDDYLKQGFLNPPDSAWPGVYWYFIDGNLDRDAIAADLESMKKAGIGYVLFLEVNVGIPRESKRYTFTTYRFYKKDDKLAESGLIGPVSIKMVNNFP